MEIIEAPQEAIMVALLANPEVVEGIIVTLQTTVLTGIVMNVTLLVTLLLFAQVKMMIRLMGRRKLDFRKVKEGHM